MQVPTPDTRRKVFQGHISWNLEDDVGDKEDRQSNVVLVACHIQVVLKTSEPCVPNVAPTRVQPCGFPILDFYVDHDLPVQVCEKVQHSNLCKKGKISTVEFKFLDAIRSTHNWNEAHVHLAHELVILRPGELFQQRSNIWREAAIGRQRRFLSA